ncbi:MAG TPA: hypothetical protein VIU61_27055 [Kofleriaceae bacterium]
MGSNTEHHVSLRDLRNLLAGEGGVDLVPVSDGEHTVMRIVGVRPGTTAARLGAQDDDTIETINDLPLDNVGAAYRAGDAAIEKPRIVIRGKRAGTTYETTLVVDRR